MADDKLVEILFRLYSDIMDEETTETLWAQLIDEENGYYRLDSIPFYLPLIAPDDIIAAEYDEAESMLMYRKTIQYSGNSAIHVILLNELNAVDDVRGIFEDMSCPTEKCNDKYFAIEVPAAIDYLYIKKKLDELAKEEILDYAESCLSEKHQQTNYLFR